MSGPGPSLVIGPTEGRPLVLAGPPDALTGIVPYHNRGGGSVVLREAGLRDPSGLLRLPSPRQVVQPRTFRPDQTGTLALSMAVDPATPPGEYRVELDLGGETHAALLHVAEVVAVSVVPRSLVLANEVGAGQSRRIIVTNEGNVAVRLDDPGPIDLRDDTPRDRPLRVEVATLPDAEELDLDALVVAVLAAARGEARAPRRLGVRFLGPDLEIRPGETKPVDLELTLQDDLLPGRRYRGHLPVLTRDVAVIVVASGGPLEPEAPPHRGRTTKATEKSPKKRGGTP